MRSLARTVFLATTALAVATMLAIVGLALMTIDGRPALDEPTPPSAQETAHVHRLLRRHDPRRAQPGQLYTVHMSPTDLSVLTDHLARTLNGASRVRLASHRLAVRASLPVPLLPAGLWLNLEAELADGPGLPQIEKLRLGSLPLPDLLAKALAERLLAWLEGPVAGEPLHRMVREVAFDPQQMRVTYRWQADAPARMFARWMPDDQLQRLRVYTAQLARLAANSDGPLDLTVLLRSLAQLAQTRSDSPRSAADENRAWLRALALYVSGHSSSSLLTAHADWPQPRHRAVFMAGRDDFPLHFMLSAMLATETSDRFADALGLAKEVDDARFGSGFSFTDMAVNRAGQRFGGVALAEPLRLQRALAQGVDADALIPSVSDLAEFMSEAAFVARFGGVDTPAYRQALTEIDRRIAALSLYR